MRFRSSARAVPWFAGAALIAAIPALGQDAPESILPPGFGDPVQDAPKDDGEPSSILPPPAQGPQAPSIGTIPLDPLDPEAALLAEGEELPLDQPVLADLPASARRSTAQVGLLDDEDGGLGPSAFGSSDGRYLSALMRSTRAPLASRWASILLRRALLSKADTPANVNGADWVAERAWLLVRMGEADMARALVQSVDVDQYTPKMFDVAMQASLASADPAALCPMVDPASEVSKLRAWSFARAMCAGLSGESGQASALIDGARASGAGRGIDGVLAEKVVGAGVNTRRSVTVEWEPVEQLTAWRYGLAAATAAEIPDRLWETAGPQVQAWRARAPLWPIDQRLQAANAAAVMGVFSTTALVDFYGQLADAVDEAEGDTALAATLGDAYSGSVDERMSALRSLWTVPQTDETPLYLRQLLTARAAARIAPSDEYAGDLDQLTAAMMSAGLDIQAARWARFAEPGSLGWALLAVGAPGRAVEWDAGVVDDLSGERRRAFALAGLAGMARAAASDPAFAREDAWTRAIERAVAAREPGTVALLAALGLQGGDWEAVSPGHLYRSVSALRRVGLTAEARMIAAEAITRA